MYEIELTDEAIQDLKWFKPRERNTIRDGIEANLRYEPMTPTRNRKQMNPNDTAEWELRIENFRVLYNVADKVRVVEIQRIGEKRGNSFFFRGKAQDL